MKIIVDAMGGDFAPDEIVKGALDAAVEFGVEVTLVGVGEEILRSMERQQIQDLPRGVEVANATECITMEDDPSHAVRQKPDSSMAVALRMLRDGEGDAVVSAGSTGALLTGATLIVKRIRGIRRAALAPALPTTDNGMLLIDCGANTECTPEYLLQFAYMGAYYMKRTANLDTPRVGLLNIGTEETKGGDLQKKTYALLMAAKEVGRLNFIGNIEAREAILGGVDVLVCDGFTGNVFLKTMEGTGVFFVEEIRKIFTKNKFTKTAYVLSRNSFRDLRKKMDYQEIGGTPLLGISKPVIKAHGSSKARAIRSAIQQAIAFASSGIIADICENIDYMKIDSDTEKA